MSKVKSKQRKADSKQKKKGEDYYHVLGGGRRGYLKVSYTPSSQYDQFSMAYGRPNLFAQDNGRILGYDTRHSHDPIDFGPCHRHYLARKEPYPMAQYQIVYGVFSKQWPAIDKHFENNVTLDNFTLTE